MSRRRKNHQQRQAGTQTTRQRDPAAVSPTPERLRHHASELDAPAAEPVTCAIRDTAGRLAAPYRVVSVVSVLRSRDRITDREVRAAGYYADLYQRACLETLRAQPFERVPASTASAADMARASAEDARRAIRDIAAMIRPTYIHALDAIIAGDVSVRQYGSAIGITRPEAIQERIATGLEGVADWLSERDWRC